jgi:hypothetical protein
MTLDDDGRTISGVATVQKAQPPANPDAYVLALDGWQRDRVQGLRAAVRAAAAFDEVVKWGHPVYLAHGPAVLIRAEEKRVLLGFWRGQRLQSIEPRLKLGGKYEMATLEIHEGTIVDPKTVIRLAKKAASLNKELGDPTKAASGSGAGKMPRRPKVR